MISYQICINGDHCHRTIIDTNNGKYSRSMVEIIRKFNTYSYAQIITQSGYSHQIRCHLAAIGQPIIRDHLFNLLRIN